MTGRKCSRQQDRSLGHSGSSSVKSQRGTLSSWGRLQLSLLPVSAALRAILKKLIIEIAPQPSVEADTHWRTLNGEPDREKIEIAGTEIPFGQKSFRMQLMVYVWVHRRANFHLKAPNLIVAFF
jgi:hypothetical protein